MIVQIATASVRRRHHHHPQHQFVSVLRATMIATLKMPREEDA